MDLKIGEYINKWANLIEMARYFEWHKAILEWDKTAIMKAWVQKELKKILFQHRCSLGKLK